MSNNGAIANPGRGGVTFSGTFDSAGNFHPQGAGSIGRDYSSGKPTLPGIGDPFAVDPYDGWVLLATVPANNNRAQVVVWPATGGEVAVIIDDGTAAAHAAPLNASVFSTTERWESRCELGRVQVYGPPNAPSVQVMVREC
jgi:hypothetical protein